MIKFGNLKRTASIMSTSVALLCCIPHEGVCADHSELAKNLVNAVGTARTSNSFFLMDQISKIRKQLEKSEDPIHESRNFLQAVIDELNVKNGTSLTLQEICQSGRQWIAAYPLAFSHFLTVLDLLEEKDSLQHRHRVNNWNFMTRSLLWSENKIFDILLILICCGAGVAIAYYCPDASEAVIAAIGTIATTIITTTP